MDDYLQTMIGALRTSDLIIRNDAGDIIYQHYAGKEDGDEDIQGKEQSVETGP